MIKIDLNNIEELLLYNSKLHNKLPDLDKHIKLWKFSILNNTPDIRRKTILNLLNAIKEQHIKILEEHFKENIVIDKYEYNATKNLVLEIENQEITGLNNLILHRTKDKIHITFWR